MRLDELRSAVSPSAGVAEAVRLLSRHGAAQASICCHDEALPAWADRRATLAAIVMEPWARRLSLTDGQPCAAALVPTVA